MNHECSHAFIQAHQKESDLGLVSLTRHARFRPTLVDYKAYVPSNWLGFAEHMSSPYVSRRSNDSFGQLLPFTEKTLIFVDSQRPLLAVFCLSRPAENAQKLPFV